MSNSSIRNTTLLEKAQEAVDDLIGGAIDEFTELIGTVGTSDEPFVFSQRISMEHGAYFNYICTLCRTTQDRKQFIKRTRQILEEGLKRVNVVTSKNEIDLCVACILGIFVQEVKRASAP